MSSPGNNNNNNQTADQSINSKREVRTIYKNEFQLQNSSSSNANANRYNYATADADDDHSPHCCLARTFCCCIINSKTS